MFLLTEDAVLVCRHELGKLAVVPTQDLVFVAGRRVLVDPDPENRPVSGCPNLGATIKPCVTSLKVEHGYSDWLRIDGRRVCLDTVTGLTDGTPPGVVEYKVNGAGQGFVEEVP